MAVVRPRAEAPRKRRLCSFWRPTVPPAGWFGLLLGALSRLVLLLQCVMYKGMASTIW
jgi:hypothetical protein